MPVLPTPVYQPPFWLVSPHLETIIPSLFRTVDLPDYSRERITTDDGDFMDLDWLREASGTKKLLIIAHGLEGNSSRPYMKGMARIFHAKGWHVLAWNCRSCSGEMNRAQRMYHHGASDDLRQVITHVVNQHVYDQIGLVGFSMGGSIILKYLGEEADRLPTVIKVAATFSVPCDLGASARALSSGANALYRKRFLSKLKKKMRLKAADFPEAISCEGLESIDHFPDFDTRYTANLHGFKDSEDFYAKSSAAAYLATIRVPTLLVNAKNDPMLPASCFPISIAEEHPYLFLEMPERGGHVGFSQGKGKPTWAEERALAFMERILVPTEVA